MVKWTAVIIPLALATAAYLFYSRHQGSAASTASRNENLPDDKDDKDIVVLRRNQEKVKREKEAQNSMISKPIFSGLPPPPVDGVNCRWVCDNITTSTTEDYKVIEEEETEEQVELERTEKFTEFVEQTTLKTAEKNVKVEYEYEKEFNFDQKVEELSTVVEIVSSTPVPETKKVDLQMEKEINFDRNEEEEEEKEEEHSSPDHALPNIDSKNNFTSSSFFFNSRRIKTPSTTEAQKFIKTEFEEEKEFNFENYEETTKGKEEGSTEEFSTESSTLGSPEPPSPSSTSTTKKPAERTLVVTDEKEEFEDFEEEEDQKVSTEKIVVEVPSSTPSISTTTKPSLEKLNYEAEKEFNFESQDDEATATQEEELITTSTSPPPTVPELPIYTLPSTEKPISISSTTLKPSLEKLNYETENEVNFDQDETQQKQEEQIKTSSSPKLPAFTSTTKQAIKTSTTSKPSEERLNYVDENEQTFDQNESRKQNEQITSPSKAPPKLPTSTPSTEKSIEISTTTTSKPSFEKLDFESENEMNFDQDETQKTSELIKTSKSPIFASTTKRSSISPSTTPKPAFKNLNYNSENEMNFEDNKQEEEEKQIITTSSSKSPKQTTTKKSSTKSTTSKIEKLNYETENEINFEQEETTKKKVQIKSTSAKLPIFTTEHSTFKTSTTPKSAFEKLDYNTENEMTFEQDENVQKQEQQTETSSSKVSHFTTSTVEKLSTTSTTPKPSLEKLNYNTENEMNFEQDENTQKNEEQMETSSQKLPILLPSTEKPIPSPSSTTNLFEKLDFESDQEFDFEQDEAQKQEKQIETASSKVPIFTVSTEQSSKVSTTAKPAFKNINFETEKEDQFQRDETQKQKQQIISTTKKSVKKSSTTTTQQSLEKLNYNTENEMTFEQDENVQKQEKQIKTSSSKAPKLPISTEQPVYLSPTTAKSPFEKLNYESENEMNFEQDEAQKEIKTSSSSKAPKLPTTTKKSGTKSTTTSKSSLEKLDYNTENEMTFGQEESIQKQKQQAETSSQKVPKLPIFPPITEKSITEREEKSSAFKEKSSTSKVKATKSTTTTKATESPKKEAFKKLDYQSDDSYNFETETAKNNNNNPAVESRSNANVKTESANQQVNVQQSIENHSDLFHQAIDVTGDGDKNTKKKMKKKKVVVANKLPSQAKSYSNAFNNFKQRVQKTSTAEGKSKNSAASDSARAMKYESGQNFKNFGERSQFFGGSAGAATTAKSAAESFSGSGSKVKNGTYSFSKKVVNSENSGGASKSSKTFSSSSGGTSELTGVNRKLIQQNPNDHEDSKLLRINAEKEYSMSFK
ncbi:hypothetical protein TYRP_023449 [Tyrophagus putrescentiae]|nr:hypothetical protein TYRP_023449 [Tyrophagus putrescentiae]